jgi:hypothetical protein
MEDDAQARRALRALGVLACLVTLATAGCKKDEDEPGRTESGLDGGANEGEIEDPRIGPDGAVQVREEPQEGCASVNGNGSGYFFCSDLLPSTMAVGSCWAAGSTLATINDAAENQFLVDEMVEDEYWIGFTDASEEGTWDWAEGSEGSSYENWDEGQPGIDDFVFIKSENGRWSTSTDVPRPYICEIWQ